MLPGNQYRFFSWVCKFSLLEALGKKQNETKTLNYEFIFCVTVGKGWTNAVKRILFWYHSEGSVSLQPRLTAVQQWGWPGWDACSLLGRPAPATAAACLCSSSARSAQCSQAHRWGFKWGQDPWEKCWKVKPGQQTAPFCSTRTQEPDPENNNYKLAVVWVYSASCSHF